MLQSEANVGSGTLGGLAVDPLPRADGGGPYLSRRLITLPPDLKNLQRSATPVSSERAAGEPFARSAG